MLLGCGNLVYYTVGYSYLDEAVSKEKAPLFFGKSKLNSLNICLILSFCIAISGMMRVFGPITGYAMSSWALSYWIVPSKTPLIKPTNHHWVGAWWLGNTI